VPSAKPDETQETDSPGPWGQPCLAPWTNVLRAGSYAREQPPLLVLVKDSVLGTGALRQTI